jgi:hypothetical protein
VFARRTGGAAAVASATGGDKGNGDFDGFNIPEHALARLGATAP